MHVDSKDHAQKGVSQTQQSFGEADGELPPAYNEIESPYAGPSQAQRPPQRPPTTSSPHPNAIPSKPQWSNQPPQNFPNQFQPQQGPFNYPPGYFCPQCHNTGIKLHNGHPCGTCERNFGQQTRPVYYAPSGAPPIGSVTYMAGDPRIGGRLCGNCKGHGVRRSLMGLLEEQCYVCRGVGRVF